MQSSRTFSVTFTTSSLSTPAAYGSLKPAPTSRLRRTSLHLRYSTVPKHVLDTTPHRPVLALQTHTVLTLDAWVFSVKAHGQDRAVGFGRREAILPDAGRRPPTSDDCAGSSAEALETRSAVRRCGTPVAAPSCLEWRGIGNSLAPLAAALQRARHTTMPNTIGYASPCSLYIVQARQVWSVRKRQLHGESKNENSAAG
jgi:hypothetical protein